MTTFELEPLMEKIAAIQRASGQSFASLDLVIMSNNGHAQFEWRAYLPKEGYTDKHTTGMAALERLEQMIVAYAERGHR